MPAEAQFLIGLIRPGQNENLTSTIPSNLNWELLLDFATRHSLVPLLHRGLSGLDPKQVPAVIFERCRTETSKIAGRNMVLKRELTSVLRLLQGNGFPVIPYKGPALTERLYGNIGLRSFDDLDLLVHKKDVLHIKKLLLANDYTPNREIANLTPTQEEAFLRFQYTYDFISRNPTHRLEVHWEIVPKTFSLILDYEGLWERCTNITFENLQVPVFSAEDLIFLLCIMGAKKGWDPLSRVHDLAQALTLYPKADYEWILQQAKKSGAQRILLVGCRLAQECFNVPVSPRLLDEANRDRQLPPLTNEIIGQLFRMNSSQGLFRPEDQFQPIHFRIRERFADRARYCFGVILTPSIGEWSTLELPGFAYFIYYFIRPIRLILKTLRRIFHPKSLLPTEIHNK